ncbi:MAG: HesA/MoeB/ThiF family protein, partial [Bacteroidota bacterium]
CTDRLATRHLIDRACAEQGIPWVHAAVEGQQLQVAVFGLAAAGEPAVRYSDVFPPESGAIHERFTCNVHGVMGPDPGIAALIQARETLNILLGRGSILAGKMLVLNLETYHQYEIKLRTRSMEHP